MKIDELTFEIARLDATNADLTSTNADLKAKFERVMEAKASLFAYLLQLQGTINE